MRSYLNKLLLCVAFFGGSFLYADQVASTSFKGLNSNENAAIIDPEFASSLLNVDVTAGGKSVKKRSGYGLFRTAAAPMHGGYHFFDATGNNVQLWGHDFNLLSAVNDAPFTQMVSSATQNSTWDCTDSQAYAYCVDSNRDAYIRTNGTTMNWYTSPLGTMVEATPDRVVVAGVSGSPNTLYVSQSNTFTNFVVGVNETDAFTEVIASPGSRLTHIRWGCGKLLWWKDQSFGYFDFENQYNAQVNTVSDTIGTFDNTSAIDPGGTVWFRGQDGHTWTYDCSSLTKQSIDITPSIQLTGRRVGNSWTQTTQSDWNAGSGNPAVTISTTLSVGDVTTSTFSVTENSNTSWSLGAVSNATVGVSSVALSTNNSGSVTDGNFDGILSGNWYQPSSTSSVVIAQITGTLVAACGSYTGQSGASWAGSTNFTNGTTIRFEAIDLSSNVLVARNLAVPNDCAWHQDTLSSAGHVGKRVRFRLNIGGYAYWSTQESYIWGGDITYYYQNNTGGSFGNVGLDTVQSGSSTITAGQFTSQAFNTGLPYSFVYTSATWAPAGAAPSIVLQKADSSSGPWLDINHSTGTNVQSNKKFLRYISSFTVSSSGDLPSLTAVQIIAKSSGVYYSAVKNAPSLSAWSTLNVNAQLNDGSIYYNIRRATQSFTVLSSTPAVLTLQGAGSLISASTGTYFQVVASFTITSATGTPPSLNDFTVNWFEGSSSDQSYMIYFDNAIWEAVAFGAGQGINNYIFKYDLINEGWTLYDIASNGFLVQDNRLYFGSPVANVYSYGNATSDNGTAVTSYWQSKVFTGPDPFLQNSLTNIDTFAKKDTGSTLTATYTLDTSTSTSYSIALSTSASIVQSRKLLPSGKLGYGFSVQYGDTSASSAWELFGYRIGYTSNPYRPTTP